MTTFCNPSNCCFFSVNVTVNSAFSKCKFLTSLCSASYVAVNTTLCSHLLLSAVLLWMWIERRPRLLQTRRAAVDRYRLPAGPTAANPPHAADREADRLTDTVPCTDRAAYCVKYTDSAWNRPAVHWGKWQCTCTALLRYRRLCHLHW